MAAEVSDSPPGPRRFGFGGLPPGSCCQSGPAERQACDNLVVCRRRLPWLLALSLTAAGSLAAHAVGSAVAPTADGGHGEAGEPAALHERVSNGYAGHVVLWLGIAAALLAVVGVRAVVARTRSRDSRGVGAGCFFLLPLIAYSSQELVERLLHAESFPFDALLEPRLLLGLALQLPFAAVALSVGWLLLDAGQRLIRFLRARRTRKPRALPQRLWTPAFFNVPSVRALSRGHPLRGPPSPA